MATKKGNALKKQLYGTPLPLPCLQDPSLKQQSDQHQQQGSVSSSNPGALISSSPSVIHPAWSSLGTLLDILGRTYSIFRTTTTHHPHLDLIQAEFHPQGQSVWVKGDRNMETLFRQGFFGKGTLSRSEATWKQRHTEGTQDGLSLEEITRQRRVERARQKKGKSQLHQGQAADTTSSTSPSTPVSYTNNTSGHEPTGGSISSSGDAKTSSATSTTSAPGRSHAKTTIGNHEESFEHLQLSMEEAFFLVFAVESISVTEAAPIRQTTSLDTLQPSTETRLSVEYRCPVSPMSIQECWLRFSEASATPQRSLSGFAINPNNPFIIRYVVYHYYRSQGWIVKDGLKYGTDFLLYKKGLVFGHSQYAVKVVPFDRESSLDADQGSRHAGDWVYSFLSPTPGLCRPHDALSWQWLLTLNRVIAQVQKTVILCHVVLPRNATKTQLSHPRSALPLYTVVEIGIKRFIPERSRG
ncbi:hypothetical protein B0O80DRAFT_118960 [Mortierella sp. GBAus27b]|nr:tRNA splicing endonuclease subunit sen2 [Mortierella sp. GBA43]KAI8350955.1 hypothetical protein B0O80DRAFT_118960 [Mortierella sp. GBAus27b]